MSQRTAVAAERSDDDLLANLHDASAAPKTGAVARQEQVFSLARDSMQFSTSQSQHKRFARMKRL